MHNRLFRVFGLLAVVALMLALLPAPAVTAQDTAPQGEVVAEGFNGPMGVLVDPNGDVWVVDSGTGGDELVPGFDFSGQPMTGTMGLTARIVKIAAADGTQTEIALLPSLNTGAEAEGGSRLALLDGKLYATGAGWHPSLSPRRPKSRCQALVCST